MINIILIILLIIAAILIVINCCLVKNTNKYGGDHIIPIRSSITIDSKALDKINSYANLRSTNGLSTFNNIKYMQDIYTLMDYCKRSNKFISADGHKIFRAGELKCFKATANDYVPISITQMYSDEHNIGIYDPNEAIYFAHSGKPCYIRLDIRNTLGLIACKTLNNTLNGKRNVLLNIESGNNDNLLDGGLFAYINKCIRSSIILDYIKDPSLLITDNTVFRYGDLQLDLTNSVYKNLYTYRNNLTLIGRVLESWGEDGYRDTLYVPDRMYIQTLFELLNIIENIWNAENTNDQINILGTYNNDVLYRSPRKDRSGVPFPFPNANQTLHGEIIIRHQYLTQDIFRARVPDPVTGKICGIDVYKWIPSSNKKNLHIENYSLADNGPIEYYATHDHPNATAIMYGGLKQDNNNLVQDNNYLKQDNNYLKQDNNYLKQDNYVIEQIALDEPRSIINSPEDITTKNIKNSYWGLFVDNIS